MNIAGGLLLACTEVRFIFPTRRWLASGGCPVFNATDILAQATIRISRGA